MKKIETNGSKSLPLTIATPPSESAPTPPRGADLTSPIPHGLATIGTLLGLVPALAAELRDSPSFVHDFGDKLAPGEVADALEHAAEWRHERTRAENWLAYIARADAKAWGPTLKSLERFRRAFDFAVQLDPDVRERYPQLVAFFEAKSAVSIRAAATRKAKKSEAKKKADEGKAAAAPTPSSKAAAS